MKKTLFISLLLVTFQVSSQQKLALKQKIADYECTWKLEEKMSKRLYKKDYYGKIIMIDNLGNLNKNFFVYFPAYEHEISIDLSYFVTPIKYLDEIPGLNEKSNELVFTLFKDLKKILFTKRNYCNLKKYNVIVSFSSSPKLPYHKYEYIFEHILLMDLLKDINDKENKQKILNMISEQQSSR